MRYGLMMTLACVFSKVGTAHAVDVPAGAMACTGCHATSKTVDTAVPGIAGRRAADLTMAMRDFKSGARPATVMGRIAKGFSDPEIEAISVWFSKQPQ